MRTAPVFSKEKLIFLKKRYLETILGGYKLNIDDEKLSIFDHFFQIFFYISPIVISIILGILIDDYYLSINIVAGINTLLNMILMLTLHCITVKKSKKTVPEEYQNIKLELLYKNKSYIEFIITLILTYAFFYLSTSNIYNIYRNDTDFIVKIVLSGVVMLISSFSLFVSQPLEISINPMDLNYNRPIYNICILIIKILFDFYLDQYSYIILIVYFLEIYGFLSGVLAEISSLFFWSIEYINLVLFGDSIKATNLRLLLGFCYNISVCILSSLIFLSEIKNIYKLVINIILLTFFNFCGLNNLFFELNLENKEFKEKNFKWNFSFFRQIFGFIIYIVSILALFFGVNEIFIENITIEYKNYIIAIGVIVLTNGILGYFVYLFQNEIIFRVKKLILLSIILI